MHYNNFRVANEKASIFCDCEQTKGEREQSDLEDEDHQQLEICIQANYFCHVYQFTCFIIIIKPCHSSNKGLHGLGTPLFHTYCR
jgi:hypothetical protein